VRGGEGHAVNAAGTHSRWRRAIPVALVAVAVGFATLMVFEYRATQETLREERATLRSARRMARAAGASLETARAETGSTRTRSFAARRARLDASDERRYFAALRRNATNTLADVRAELDQKEIALYAVATNANAVQRCLDGVSTAAADVLRGKRSRAVDALNDSADHCATTIAVTTGSPFPYDFPDPYVLRFGRHYYAYATNSGGGEIQVIRSRNLTSWSLVGDGLANVPTWARPNATWAPAVLPRIGGFVLYYTVRDAASGRQCISRAVSAEPGGPFLDDSRAPLVCQLDHGGSIDPSVYVDAGGQAWLLWKSEGFGAAPATLWSQPLAPDGRSLTGTPSALVSADRWFEDGVVEAPSLAIVGGRYVLLYSSGDWRTRGYNVAYATCDSPAGPCAKPTDGRLLRSGERLAGPGGAEIFRDGRGDAWVAYHAFSEPDVGYPNTRYFHLARLRWAGSRPAIDAET
jgi:hypothetical protein